MNGLAPKRAYIKGEWIDHPIIHFTRPQVAEEVDAPPEQKQSWQEALFAMQEVQSTRFASRMGM